MDTLDRKRDPEDSASIWERLRRVDDHRLFTVFEALRSGSPIGDSTPSPRSTAGSSPS